MLFVQQSKGKVTNDQLENCSADRDGGIAKYVGNEDLSRFDGRVKIVHLKDFPSLPHMDWREGLF